MTTAYLRVSTTKQELDNQRFEIERYATDHGLSIDRWVEETVSGTKSAIERELGSVLSDLEHGDTLIVSEISRLGRKVVPVMAMVQDLIERGATVIAVKQGFKFGDDINSKVIAFAFGLAAEIERNLISARTKEALARKKAEGVQLGRPAGTYHAHHYKLHGRDDDIIALLRSRVSLSAIARHMNVNRETLRRYIADRELDRKCREQTGV